MKSGNGQLRQYWSNSIEDAKRNITALKDTVSQTDKTTEAYIRFQKAYKDSEADAVKYSDTVKKTLNEMRQAEEQRIAALTKAQQKEQEAAAKAQQKAEEAAAKAAQKAQEAASKAAQKEAAQ